MQTASGPEADASALPCIILSCRDPHQDARGMGMHDPNVFRCPGTPYANSINPTIP